MRFARRTNWVKRALWGLAGCRSGAAFLPGRAPGSILLTFDDGPHPEHAPAVLDRLAAFNLSAAFFLVGNRIADPALVRRIAAAGHLLGNHTYSHEIPRWRDFTSAREDVAKCQELVPEARLFRPPLGRLTPGLWLAARRLGLKCVNWSLDSGDWRCRSESDAMTCAREVLALARPGDIVLFHDNHRWIKLMLDVVLPGLAAQNTSTISSPPCSGLPINR